MGYGKSILPFWAPPSAGSKSHAVLDTNKSYNTKVNQLSRETKEQKILNDYDNRSSCWEKDEHIEARKLVMMRLDDAKECTFTPKVGTKMPKKHKELVMEQYQSWAATKLSLDQAGFNKWIKRMGKNLSSRFPTIYKYGKFKRALQKWRNGFYNDAY